MNPAVMLVRFDQLVLGQQQAAEAVVRAQFKLGVHLDGVERTNFDANLAAHAHRNINVKHGGIKLGLSFVIRLLVLAFDDVNALRRAFLLANLTGHAAQSLLRVVAIINQKGKLPGVFLGRQAFLGILHGGEPVLRDVTPEEIPGGHRHALDDCFA